MTGSSPPTRRVVEIVELLIKRHGEAVRLSDIVKSLGLHQATAHMIMSDDGAFATSQLLGASDTYSIDLTRAGTYKYHCAVHPNMVGTITVAP